MNFSNHKTRASKQPFKLIVTAVVHAKTFQEGAMFCYMEDWSCLKKNDRQESEILYKFLMILLVT